MFRMPNTRLQSVTKKQISLIIDYMETHEEMCAGKLTPTFTKAVKNNLWEDLTDKLNAIANSESRECVKSVAKWQRTWIDWRSSVRKKARYLKREKSRGVPVKPLSPLERRAMRLFRKVDAEFSQADSDTEDIDHTSQSAPVTEELDKSISVKIENVMSVPESDTMSTAITFTTTAGTTTASTKVKDASPAVAVTSAAAISDAYPVTVKEEVPTALNNIFFVPIESAPLFAIKDATPTVINIPTVNQKETPNIIVTDNLQREDILRTVESRSSTIAGSSSTNTMPRLNSKTNSQTAKMFPEQRNRENAEGDLESSEPPRKRRSEDSLGGLPLTLQNSILERLDTLNRNIETNTCALTILAKAINDSADTKMRAVNHLAKVISNVGNLLGSSLEFLKTNKAES